MRVGESARGKQGQKRAESTHILDARMLEPWELARVGDSFVETGRGVEVLSGGALVQDDFSSDSVHLCAVEGNTSASIRSRESNRLLTSQQGQENRALAAASRSCDERELADGEVDVDVAELERGTCFRLRS